MHVCTHIHICVYVYMCICVCMCVYVYACIYVHGWCVCMHTCACLHVHVYAYCVYEDYKECTLHDPWWSAVCHLKVRLRDSIRKGVIFGGLLCRDCPSKIGAVGIYICMHSDPIKKAFSWLDLAGASPQPGSDTILLNTKASFTVSSIHSSRQRTALGMQ